MLFDWDDFHETNHHLDLFERLKEANPLFRATVFAIPGRCSPEFLESIPDWLEVAAHGWMHPNSREAENWTRDETLDVLLSLHGRFVDGWKSPGWQISDGTYEALLDLGWWCADHPDNDDRRPDGLLTHVHGEGEHWHGHIQDVCDNGLEQTFNHVLELVEAAESFEVMSEVVYPWRSKVAA